MNPFFGYNEGRVVEYDGINASTLVELFGQGSQGIQTQVQVNDPNQQGKQGQLDPQGAKITSIDTQLQETKSILQRNIESLTERGERLEHLDQRTRTSFVAFEDEKDNSIREVVEMDGLRKRLERLMADGVAMPSFRT